MNEVEQAELFNKELDSLLRDGKSPVFSSDPGALSLAAELARADFSADSLIRESLRERLAGQPGLLESLRALFANNYARAALAAAVLVIALLPLARRHEVAAPGPAATAARPPQAPVHAPALARSAVPPLPPLPAAPAAAVSAGAGGLFASIPMGRLEGVAIKNFPITPAGSGLPMVLAAGREVKLENGSGIVFETGGAVFTLERKVISHDDIFERRVL
ncbi:MAG TPA: hypothetical protein DEQ38_12660 [Elusimicrobia bacterium]|nr:MAG: hypothetical protein A2089_08585 [Elusimicrobia bacterium GWD2_63_28]HCC48950.1 hypothetical protein [Elusimicrobiota bacterium]